MMILADKISALRKKNGWSQEELADKMNVSRQSVSKWESAQSIPDINKILDLSKLFGVTTDYLLKDEESEIIYSDDDDSSANPKVSIKEANDFMKAMIKYGKSVGLGVMLCILSPVILILLGGISDGRLYGGILSEDAAGAIGVVILLLMIAVAVAIFIISDSRMKRFKYLDKSDFELEYGVLGIVEERRKNFEEKYTKSVIAGIALCILSVAPLIGASSLNAPDIVYISLTALLLVIISIGVFIFVYFGTIKNSYDKLLKDGDFNVEEIEKNKKASKLSGIYWPIATAIYLGWSFITNDWNITWIVWPVAGLIYAAISAVLKKD